MPRWPATSTPFRPPMSRLARDRRGAAAVEFALVSTVFLFGLFAALAVSLVVFLRLELDYATSKAARQVMNGTVQKGGYSSDSFRSQMVCANLPGVFDCGDVIVNLQTATEAASPGGYYPFLTGDLSGLVIPPLDNSATSFSTGAQGSYEYLQVIYPITFLPALVGDILSNGHAYKGSPAYLAISTAAFRNEQY